MVSILLIALAEGVGSPASWMLLSAVALGPPLLLLQFTRKLPRPAVQPIRDKRR